MTEFELIRRYFASQPLARNDVRVGIGDDAAVFHAPTNNDTVITSDVLVADVHFYADAAPEAIGYKSLAVNISDLAALGAEPAWFLLDLTLPEVRPAWLEKFASGMFELAQRHRMQLIGGDTARGPLSIAITAVGFVPYGKGLLRSGAQVGDDVYVTGALGDAALALAHLQHKQELTAAERTAVIQRLERPTPRAAEGIALRDLAASAIDVSDGLLADLGHILTASNVGARLQLDTIPLSATYRAQLPAIGWDYALAGGDDYELCFTAPAANAAAIHSLAEKHSFALTKIGEITAATTLELIDCNGQPYVPKNKGHDHFASHD
ncbi:MAG: thiamine-phosphate kinase [Gammaproteobacteria bacterium]|nr:thiamine-phosphate kinase [Gammaproteobacteria bacterium]